MKKFLVGLVFTALLFMLSFGFFSAGFSVIKEYEPYTNYTSTTSGIVVSPLEGKSFNDRIDSVYKAMARFEVEGKEYKCEVPRETVWQEGDTVVVAYDPSDPTKATSEEYRKGADMAKTVACFMNIGIVFFSFLLGFLISNAIFKHASKKAETPSDIDYGDDKK